MLFASYHICLLFEWVQSIKLVNKISTSGGEMGGVGHTLNAHLHLLFKINIAHLKLLQKQSLTMFEIYLQELQAFISSKFLTQ